MIKLRFYIRLDAKIGQFRDILINQSPIIVIKKLNLNTTKAVMYQQTGRHYNTKYTYTRTLRR